MAVLETKTAIDLLHYEPPQVIGATVRQLVCMGVAVLVGGAVYGASLLLPFIPSSVVGYALLPITIPCIFFGWVSPYGLRLEQWLVILFHHFTHKQQHCAASEVIYCHVPIQKGESEYPGCPRPQTRSERRRQLRAVRNEAKATRKALRAEGKAKRAQARKGA